MLVAEGKLRVWGAIGFLPLAALGIAASCASDPDRAPTLSLDAGADAAGMLDEAGNLVGNGSTDGHPCVNLECQQIDCAMHHLPDTTVSGIVYDPAGARPLYNVIVYVPNGPVEPMQSGVVCDQCGVVASGHPLVTTLTGADGRFTLHDVPAGPNVPLVLQLGKWRRQIVIPDVDPCTVNTMTNPGTMRLPSKQSEGDMPQIAITTGRMRRLRVPAPEDRHRSVGVHERDRGRPRPRLPGRRRGNRSRRRRPAPPRSGEVRRSTTTTSS